MKHSVRAIIYLGEVEQETSVLLSLGVGDRDLHEKLEALQLLYELEEQLLL